ncbi:hypothetical protein ACN3XK_72605 [Actinomadura welshii]
MMDSASAALSIRWTGGMPARGGCRPCAGRSAMTGGKRPRGWVGRLLAEGENPDPRFTLANERTFLA